MSAGTMNGWSALLLRRGFQMLAMAVIIGTICFLMTHALPGDMAMRIAAGRYGFDLVDSTAADAVRTELSAQLTGTQALAAWLGDLLRLDLGQSLVTGEAVWAEVSHQLGATLRLSLTALLLAALIGVPLGLWAGRHPGGRLDRTMMAATVVLRATPPFLLAVLLMLLVAVKLGALPVAGDEGAHSLLLPGLTLALGLAAGLARVLRNTLIEVGRMPSHEFARTKGLSDWQTLCRHDLRNAAIPAVAYLGVQAVFLVEGTVVVETLFAWPGIGHALVHAVFARDVPVIQGTALMIGLLFVSFNLLIDATCLLLDPRQRRPRSG